MFPAETFVAMQNAANKADFKVLSSPNSTGRSVVFASGDITKDVDRPIRKNKLITVADVAKMHEYFVLLNEMHNEELDGHPAVWICMSGIIIVRNDSYSESMRLDRAELKFEQSTDYAKLLSLGKIDERTGQQVIWGQQQLLRLTRTTFYDSFASATTRNELQAIIKSMSQTTELGQGMLSNQTTSSAGPFPNFFTLYVRVFNDPVLRTQTRHAIRIHVDVLPQSKGFELTPNTSDLEEAMYAEIDAITKHLRSELNEEAFLFQGTPE